LELVEFLRRKNEATNNPKPMESEAHELDGMNPRRFGGIVTVGSEHTSSNDNSDIPLCKLNLGSDNDSVFDEPSDNNELSSGFGLESF